MGTNGPFGFDPDEFDRVAREAGEGLRDVIDGLSRFLTTPGERSGWTTILDEFGRQTRRRTEPETTGETGDGVWVIYTVDGDGGAHIDQVYATELDALRAHKNNTDESRKVRFLPYGMASSVLDAPGSSSDDGTHDAPE